MSRRLALASRRLRTRCVLVENMRGEWQRGAMLANASMPPKATGINKNKEAGLPARPPARRPSLSLLERGDRGRRLALAGRRPTTRCVLVLELFGLGDRMLGGCCWSSQLECPFGHSTSRGPAVSGFRGSVCCCFAAADKSAAAAGAGDGECGMLDSSAPIRCRRGRGVEMPAGVAVASDETGRGVPGPTTGRPGVPRRGGVGAAGADVHGDGGLWGRGRGGNTEPVKA